MNLFPKIKTPYYIVTPSYTHTSSGVRTLHLLCHALNEMGQRAYLVPARQYEPGNFTTHPHLNTPVISKELEHINFYGNEGIDPIFVYPDIVDGNPFDARRVVRYLLAKPGGYGRVITPPALTDQVWGALPSIAENVLRIPVSDPDIFRLPNAGRGRKGSCFYSHKYDGMAGNKLLPLTKGSTRLKGPLERVADILRASEVCYLYEMSSIITEAALCDCPVVLVRTDFFNKIDPEAMMGQVCWSDGEFVKECKDYHDEYESYLWQLPMQIQNFIEKTQAI